MLQLSGWVSKVKDSMTDVLSSFGIDDGEPGGEAVSAVRPVDDELEIDDSLSVQEKIVKYLRSDLILHRLYLVRELAEYGLQLGYAETVAHLLPLLSEIKADVEPVIRQALVEQIPILATQLKEVPESGVVDIINVLLPIVVGLTRDSNPQVRLSSTEALIGLAATLPLHLLEKNLLPVIDSLATDTSQEEYRIEAARLVQHLAKSMGSRLCIEFAVPLMLKMAKDNFRIRKVVAANIGLLAESVGAEVTTAKLLPLFVKMSGDEIWGVRKSCAESLVALSSVLSNSDRLQHLVPIFQKLAEDQSRWVRNSAFEHLGHFIVTFQDSEVPASLVKYYTEMVLQTNQKFSDSELVNYCAFDFPGVILTLGAARWNEVREAYFKLCADLQWKVRRPLAHSLHEVANILGGEATVVDLLSIFETFLKDLDEVKVGVVRHLAAFLQILPAEHREQYLSVISDVTNETSNWRFRKLMARQLGALSSLYGPETVAERLVPISVQLCQDSVAGVRRVAHREVGLLINRLENGQDGGKMRDDYIRQIVSFGAQSVDSSYVERQIFAQVCGYVCEQVSPACFTEHFLPGLLLLATDRIPNVRLTVAQVLVLLLLEHAAYESNESVQKTLQLLQKDKDRDVVFYAQPQNLVRKMKEKAKTK